MNVLRKNRTLSHPNFQSYRLAPTADPERQLSIDIPQLHHPRSPFDGLPSLNAGRYHAHIFDRFLTHHLAPGYPLPSGVAQAAYVDQHGKVVILRIQHRSEDDVDVSFHPVFQLTQTQQQEDTSAPPQQSPSIIAIDPHTWLAADGSGQVSTLTISEDDTGKLSAKARSALVQDESAASSDDDRLRPVKLVAAASSNIFVAQTIAREDVTVSAHAFASPLLGKPQWSATTSEPLLLASIEKDASLLVGSAALSLSNSNNAQIAEGEASSSTPSSSTTAARSMGNHPFTWYQTTDALTVTFPLSSSLTSADFDIQFKSHHISISIDLPEELRITELDPSPSSRGGEVHAQPRASAALAMERITTGAFASSDADSEGRKLWGDVDPSASFWTWERPPLGTTTAEANEERTGYLTLHLEKRHHGTRWTHLFAPQKYESAHGDGDGDLRDVVSSSTEPEHKRARVEHDQHVDDVPETIDPSERIIMLEGLEKYTSALGGDESGQGLGTGLGSRGAGGASLLEDGFEDEDANVGRDSYLLHISSTHPRRASDSSRTQILGLPIPSTSAGNAAPSSKVLIVKDEIDGLAFVSTSASSGGAAAWEHKSTLPALAYVLASKQDASHRVYAHQDRAGGRVQVLAFEGSPPSRLGGGGAGAARMGARAGAGNLFVYYSAPATADSKRVTHAESRVIRLGAGGGYGDGAASGSLIAVAKVIQRNGDGVEKELLLILCQNQLLVMPDLLL